MIVCKQKEGKLIHFIHFMGKICSAGEHEWLHLLWSVREIFIKYDVSLFISFSPHFPRSFLFFINMVLIFFYSSANRIDSSPAPHPIGSYSKGVYIMLSDILSQHKRKWSVAEWKKWRNNLAKYQFPILLHAVSIWHTPRSTRPRTPNCRTIASSYRILHKTNSILGKENYYRWSRIFYWELSLSICVCVYHLWHHMTVWVEYVCAGGMGEVTILFLF